MLGRSETRECNRNRPPKPPKPPKPPEGKLVVTLPVGHPLAWADAAPTDIARRPRAHGQPRLGTRRSSPQMAPPLPSPLRPGRRGQLGQAVSRTPQRYPALPAIPAITAMPPAHDEGGPEMVSGL